MAEYVAFIKNKYHRHTISLSGSQKAVDERGAGLRTYYGNDQQSLIDIGSQYMALLGEVDAFANDIVLAVLNLRNPVAFTHSDAIAHGHWIGRADSLDAEITLHLTIKELAIVRQDGVPASCILND